MRLYHVAASARSLRAEAAANIKRSNAARSGVERAWDVEQSTRHSRIAERLKYSRALGAVRRRHGRRRGQTGRIACDVCV